MYSFPRNLQEVNRDVVARIQDSIENMSLDILIYIYIYRILCALVIKTSSRLQDLLQDKIVWAVFLESMVASLKLTVLHGAMKPS